MLASVLFRGSAKTRSLSRLGLISSSELDNLFSGACPHRRGIHDDETMDEVTAPWVRQVISGSHLMRNPKYNKGLAFSDEERDRLHLRGLVPPAVLAQSVQLERCMLNIRRSDDPLDKYTYLLSLFERNQTLFFRVLVENFEELLPIIHNPTVRMACRKYSLMFRSIPMGMFITLQDRGRVYSILKNWPEKRVKLMVITDGARVGPLLDPDEDCDLGVQAMGVPVSKLMMYTTCGGIHPDACVPVCIDVGTDNQDLLQSPFYVGSKHRRVRGEAYAALLDEFLMAVKRRFGNSVFLQFVDMQHETATELVNVYRSDFPCLHDGTHGRAAAILAGVLASLPLMEKKLEEAVIMLVGMGELASNTAEFFAMDIAGRTGKTVMEARQNIWLVDDKGLVTRERPDRATVEEYKIPYMHPGAPCVDLLSSVNKVKPDVLIGCSFTSVPPFDFDKAVCQAMAKNCKRPLIFPLSPSRAEVSAYDAYSWTDGRCLFADQEGATSIVTLADGRKFFPAQCHTTYIFPGIALGTLISRSIKLSVEQYIDAAKAVAKLVTKEDLARGAVYPPLKGIREVAARVGVSVAQRSYEEKTATNLPKPHSLLDLAKEFMYNPVYRSFR
ncbi:hypothetical protein BSKO_12713 [Bryopsis sp. KO-2023]|nr:hypothetical protein BSKO_12713 [Bryopsis sp. KO-2023]